MHLERARDLELDANAAPSDPPPSRDFARPPVSQVMRHEVVSLSPDQRLSRAADLFLEEHLPHIPVIDAGGHVIGAVSERDLRARVSHTVGEMLDVASVADVMTPNPMVARDTDSLRDVADYLLDERFEVVPVVDAEERLVGSLSYVDILAWMVDHAA